MTRTKMTTPDTMTPISADESSPLSGLGVVAGRVLEAAQPLPKGKPVLWRYTIGQSVDCF